MIRFENVTKTYNNESNVAVDNLSIHIREGEICMLVGPSGCGKTTTMKMLNKLIKPDSGNIFINGKNIENLDSIKLRLNIGYIIQDIGLFPHMTIAENIATVPVELGWGKDKINARVDELLELMELEPKIYRDKKPKELSGGQKQRVGVARALAANPTIMLMDEPFGALDPITRGKLQDEFLKIQQKIRKTIIFVTHDMDEAIKMGDKIAVLKKGKIIQLGTPSEILSRPANKFVSELIGSNISLKMMNLIKCRNLIEEVNTLDVDITKEVISKVSIEATAQDVLSQMLNTGKRYVLVEDSSHEIKGIITIDKLLKVVSDNGNMAI